MFFVIGTLVLLFISLAILSRWIGERRYDRALKETDYGVVCNFMCDITNKLIGLSPSHIVKRCIGYYLNSEFGKDDRR